MIASAPIAFVAYLMIYRCSEAKDDFYKYYGGGEFFKEFNLWLFLIVLLLALALEFWIWLN